VEDDIKNLLENPEFKKQIFDHGVDPDNLLRIYQIENAERSKEINAAKEPDHSLKWSAHPNSPSKEPIKD
jgi:hypothetical protein